MTSETHSSGHIGSGAAGRDLAGRDLAETLSALSLDRIVIVALSPQSVDLAFNVSRRLGCELDLLLVGCIPAPGHPETMIGSVIDLDEPQVVVDEDLAREFHVPPGYLNTERQRQLSDLERRHFMYLGDDDDIRHDHAGKDVVIFDHGIDAAILQLVFRRLAETGAQSVRVVPVASSKEQVDDHAVALMLKQARRFHKLLH